MKERVLKGGIYLAVFMIMMVGFPWYFRVYPDFKFFWNICAVLAIGYQMFFMIAGEKEKRGNHLKIVSAFLLSVIMSNGYYRFEALAEVLPFLNGLTESSLFGLGVLTILLFAACGEAYHIYVKKIRQEDKAFGPQQQGAADSAAATMEQAADMASMLPRHMVGIAAAVIFIASSAAMIFYALCKNQDFLLRLTDQKLPYLVFNMLTGFGIVLAAIFVVTILTFYFIQMCCAIIREMFQHHRLDIQNDSFLKCISVFITMFCFFYCCNSTIKDLFDLVNGSNGAASLLIVVMAFTAFAFLALVIYKILKSFACPDGTLRYYTDKIFSLIIMTIGDTIINILDAVSKIPGFIDVLLDAIKRGGGDLWRMLLNMDEEEDIRRDASWSKKTEKN